VSDLHQLAGVAQIKVLNGLMSEPKITTSMTYQILECPEDHMEQLMKLEDVMLLDSKDE
jgi:hypothetical protein